MIFERGIELALWGGGSLLLLGWSWVLFQVVVQELRTRAVTVADLARILPFAFFCVCFAYWWMPH